MKTLFELMAEDEEKAIAKARAEIAKEDAAYAALSQEEKDKIKAARDAYWDHLESLSDETDEEDEDEDEDQEDED